MPPVKMTRAEYQAKYGAPTAAPSSAPLGTAPVQMTRAQYESKYGNTPQASAAPTMNKYSTIPLSKGGALGAISDFGIGAGSAIGKTVVGAGQAALGVVGGIGKLMPNSPITSGINQNVEKMQSGLENFKQGVFQKPFQGSLDTLSGQAGEVVGNIAPYFLTGGASASVGAGFGTRALVGTVNAVPDALLSTAQSGGDWKSGLATGVTSAVANTLVPGSGGFVSRTTKKAIPGYVGDVSSGLAGQRGEDRTGAAAFIPGAGTALGTVLGGVSTTLSPAYKEYKIQGVITKREKALQKLEDSYSGIRKVTENAKGKGVDVKKILAQTDLLHGAVDKTGTIRTTQTGGAVEELTNFIKPQEDVISRNLAQEGTKINLKQVERKLTGVINSSNIEGADRIAALNKVKKEVAGLRLRADKEGNIPLSKIHDAKVYKYAHVDYLNPTNKTSDKAIAKGLKQLVEENTKSVDVRKLNQELASHYSVLNLLENLDGKKVEGGRLGKYFASTLGGVIGSHFGPLGTILGAESARYAKGVQMSQVMNGKTGRALGSSDAMKAAVAKGQLSRSAGSLNTTQSRTIPPSNIEPIVLKKRPPRTPLGLPAAGESSYKDPNIIPVFPKGSNVEYVGNKNVIIPKTEAPSPKMREPQTKNLLPEKAGPARPNATPLPSKFSNKIDYTGGFVNRKVVNTVGGASLGALAGVKRDENGNITYDKKRGLAGAALGGAIGYGGGQAGLSMKDISPEKIAKNMDKIDVDILSQWLTNNGNKPALDAKANRMLDDMGTKGMSTELRRRFAEEATRLAEARLKKKPL